MAEAQDRILIVESDPVISDFISRQALQAAGYQVFIVTDASAAISRAIQISPDVIIANLELPGLSGKDLLVALLSQGLNMPVIMTARKGMESEIIQAFRLGAADYLIWPSRETEVLSAVERNLKQVRERREREHLAEQLEQANQELQQRVRELTTIFSVGKAVTSITDQLHLFDKILESAIKATQADLGWFLLRDENSKAFLLVAHHKLPASLPVHLHQPWDDGISSLVAMSGEPLSIHGEPLKRFKISSLGQSALIIPIKASRQVIGLLTLVRRTTKAYTTDEQRLVEAIADFASISLVNARLFRVLEERVRHQQILAENALMGEKITSELLQKVKNELHLTLTHSQKGITQLTKDPTTRWSNKQRQELATIEAALSNLSQLAEAITPMQTSRTQRSTRRVNMNDLVRKSASQFLPFAQRNNLTLVSDLPSKPIFVHGDESQIAQILNSLISNAIKYSNPGGQVRVQLEKVNDQDAHITVSNSGVGIEPRQLAKLFDRDSDSEQSKPGRFGGLGVGLALAKELITRQNGKIWAESKKEQGTCFHLTLPTL
jgi:signal transduction histidine kinase/DNA-binding response OmpR family regulator